MKDYKKRLVKDIKVFLKMKIKNKNCLSIDKIL